jgi:hypothetical protein
VKERTRVSEEEKDEERERGNVIETAAKEIRGRK